MAKKQKTITSNNFALIGAAGYVAPRHLKAIKETGNELITAIDPHDSVGILDQYFPKTHFFTEFERFDRHIEKLKREGGDNKINYVSICSPNYLHDAHIRFALRVGAHAICEKPLVLNPWNIDQLKELEQEYNQRIYTVLQLRVHPAMLELKKKIEADKNKHFEIELTYITSRGSWYLHSWKGDIEKSGGISTNIGIHFFDLLIWLFGGIKESIVHYADPNKMCGSLELPRALVKWFLSVDANDLPNDISSAGNTTYRSLTIGGKEVEFSKGFTDLHTLVYQDILSGGGYGLEDTRPSIELVHAIRNATPVGIDSTTHPLAKKILK